MGTLRISNELLLTDRELVETCLRYLKEHHMAVIHGKRFERKDVVYEMTGEDIPDREFQLEVHTYVPGVISIKIIE